MEIPKGLAVRRLVNPLFTFNYENIYHFQFRANFEVCDKLSIFGTDYVPYLLAPQSLSNWS